MNTSQSSQKSVLVVDDDQTQQVLIADMLVRRGRTNIVSAADGDIARNLIDKKRDSIGLIICDLYMPNFDGVEFLLHLKELSCEIPIIIISGARKMILKSAEELARVHALNLVAAMPKPVNLETLGDMVVEHID